MEQEEQPPLDITGDQPALSLTGSERVTYGQTLQFGTTGGAGSGNVTYAVQNISGSASISAGGLLTPVKAGTVLVTASKAGDGRYGPTSSEGVVVTIYPASLTITVRDKRAQVGDPIPALTASDYTISGLVGGDRMQTLPTLSYERTPDMARADRVTIRASGAAVPSGGNYAPDIRYVPGTLTVSERPVYGILVRQAANGTLSADQTSAEPGTRITVTAKAAEGYQVETVTATADGGNRLRLTDKGNGVFAFTMPDGPVTVTGTFVKAEVPPVVLPFTDVKEGDWFYENVAYVFANGLMNGTSETQFSPGRAITRGMIVTILYRMEGSPATAAWSPFADVAAEKYYAVPVAWAAWNGIVNGQSATAFGPEAPVTREQLAAIFYRYAGYKGYDTNARANLTRFADGAQVHAYAETALSWANAEALVSGKGNGILDPRGQATRAQAAAIFQRFCAWIVP